MNIINNFIYLGLPVLSPFCLAVAVRFPVLSDSCILCASKSTSVLRNRRSLQMKKMVAKLQLQR